MLARGLVIVVVAVVVIVPVVRCGVVVIGCGVIGGWPAIGIGDDDGVVGCVVLGRGVIGGADFMRRLEWRIGCTTIRRPWRTTRWNRELGGVVLFFFFCWFPACACSGACLLKHGKKTMA